MDNATVLHGDCLQLLQDIPDQSIDMIFCDLPYGMTACKWDTPLDLNELWKQYMRIIKPNRAIVLTGSMPFSARLVSSNYKWFKCEWIWEKSNGTNYPNAKIYPMKVHENILVFSNGTPLYHPLMVKAEKSIRMRGAPRVDNWLGRNIIRTRNYNSSVRYPRSIQKLKHTPDDRGKHRTQKPVSLCEYFIKTYSNPGDIILDNCAGSGTTGVAALKTGRRCILMEKEFEFIEIINERLNNVQKEIE